MKKLVITGGNGCIGSWIARLALERGYDVTIYDRLDDRHRLMWIMSKDQISALKFRNVDVTNLDQLREGFLADRTSHVIHLAGLQTPACRENPILGAQVNVLGTMYVFEAVKALGDQIQGVVYASSAAVYGPADLYDKRQFPLDESVTPLPQTQYGTFKLGNEGSARAYWVDSKIPSIGLRPWTVFGVGRDLGMTSEPSTALCHAAFGRPHRISFGGLEHIQFVEDVALTFLKCLEARHKGAEVYNLRHHVIRMEELIAAIEAVDPGTKGLITFNPRQLPIAPDLCGDALEMLIGLQVYKPLEDGIRFHLDMFRRLGPAQFKLA